jgi:DNA-binding NarL/FixJ family response regulator
MGLERLLTREAGLTVSTYSTLPVPEEDLLPSDADEEPQRRRPARPGAPPRIAVISDRGVADIAADCDIALRFLADEAVLLSSRPDISDMLGALGVGVRSFATEGEGAEVLVASIRHAARHRTYLSQQTLEVLVEWLAERERPAGRARRERENDLLRLLAEGRSTSEIADRMGIAPKTVRNRVSKLYRRLGVHSRAAAVRMAEERGMLEPTDRRS